jgi:hypothetical protein
MRKLAFVSFAAALCAAIAVASAHAGAKQTVAMTFDNITFTGISDACPARVLTSEVLSLRGAPLGTGESCIQSTVGCEDFAVGCRQRVETILTFALAGREPVTMAATLREVLLDDDPVTFAQVARGRVVSGRGRLSGAGAITFTADGAAKPALVWVLTLGGRG